MKKAKYYKPGFQKFTPNTVRKKASRNTCAH